jgi:SnoaL-like domain
MDDRASVLSANLAFYQAFERKDPVAMRNVWAGAASDCCIHPGWEIARGWAAIRATWTSIFANDTPMSVIPEQVGVDVWGNVARVVLVERVSMDGEAIGRVAVTNLFVRTPEGWRMTLHHGSPITPSEEEEEPDDIH